MHTNKELAVAALRNGTVIDHIPPEALFKCVAILGLASTTRRITIGNNLESDKLGSKGIIKVADTFFPDLDALPNWKIERTGEAVTENGLTYRFVDYVNTALL